MVYQKITCSSYLRRVSSGTPSAASFMTPGTSTYFDTNDIGTHCLNSVDHKYTTDKSTTGVPIGQLDAVLKSKKLSHAPRTVVANLVSHNHGQFWCSQLSY